MPALTLAAVTVLSGALHVTASAATAATPAASAEAASGTSSAPSTAVREPVAVAANGRYILRLEASSAPGDVEAELRAAVAGAGGRLLAVQPALGTAVVRAPATARAALAGLPRVVGIAADDTVHPTSLVTDAEGQAGALARVADLVGARTAWAGGWTGAGVDVALLDTGIAPIAGFQDPAKVVIGPDLSFESQQESIRSLDTYGHGTNMAGILAAREGAKATGTAYAADTTHVYGIAPDARLVSLKLADRNGAVDVSQMIAAIDWVVQNRTADGLNIRVLNISYGTLSGNSAQADPLAWAAESAWHAGIVVVASAGNEADRAGTTGLASPAFNPWVLAVGAADTKGTVTVADDTVPDFSQRASGPVTRGPDVLAPGVGIVSLGVRGSNLVESHPNARIGLDLLRGSGTSQAAAVVSGTAALLLQKYPSMTPDDVKAQLTRTATALPGVSGKIQGSGEVNVAAALAAPAAKGMQFLAWGNGFGSLDKARGGYRVTMDGTELSGERDIMGSGWDAWTMSYATGSRTAWKTGGVFNGKVWIGADGLAVDTTLWTSSWSGRRWTSISWSGRTWSSSTWNGRRWTSDSWSGRTWSGSDWSSGSWTGNGWSADSWETPVDEPSWAGRVWSSQLWQ